MTFFTQAVWQGGPRRPAQRLPECGRCGLYKTCLSPKMEPQGKGKHSILFVGEAPGHKEDEKGTQLIGKSGKRLRKTLGNLGINLDNCHKTNAIICRPPENKIEDLHIDSCRPNLLKTIRELKPTVIVLLGSSAVKSLMPTEREATVGAITKWVGWKIPSHEHQAWICPTYHPSHLLRSEDKVLDLFFDEHIAQAVALEDVPVPGEDLEHLKGQVELILSPRDARLRLKDLRRKKGIIAFDYESTSIKPDHPGQRILACSICFEGSDTFSFAFDDSHKRPLSRVLLSKRLRKVAHNIKNEDRWSKAKLGHWVRNWLFDPMLAAHTLDNRRDITGLKFQAYVNFGIADYDSAVDAYMHATKKITLPNGEKIETNRLDEFPKKDLLTYNGLDSLLTFKLMEKQREALGV